MKYRFFENMLNIADLISFKSKRLIIKYKNTFKNFINFLYYIIITIIALL